MILLTGLPRVGKTTVIRQVADGLGKQRMGGFYTEEIRDRTDRLGFQIITFDGQKQVMAHIDFPMTLHVGRYGVDLEAIDSLAVPALTSDEQVDLYLIDEIGKMECLSNLFVQAMRQLVQSGKPIVATVAQMGDGFIKEIKDHPSAWIWEVTQKNRNQMPGRVLNWIAQETNLNNGVNFEDN